MKQNVTYQRIAMQSAFAKYGLRNFRKMSLYAVTNKGRNHSANRLHTDPLPASQQALFPEFQAATFAAAQHLPDSPCRLH